MSRPRHEENICCGLIKLQSFHPSKETPTPKMQPSPRIFPFWPDYSIHNDTSSWSSSCDHICWDHPCCERPGCNRRPPRRPPSWSCCDYPCCATPCCPPRHPPFCPPPSCGGPSRPPRSGQSAPPTTIYPEDSFSSAGHPGHGGPPTTRPQSEPPTSSSGGIRTYNPNISAIKTRRNARSGRSIAIDRLQSISFLLAPLMREYGLHLSTLGDLSGDERHSRIAHYHPQTRTLYVWISRAEDTNEPRWEPQELLKGGILAELARLRYERHETGYEAFVRQLNDRYDELATSGYRGEGGSTITSLTRATTRRPGSGSRRDSSACHGERERTHSHGSRHGGGRVYRISGPFERGRSARRQGSFSERSGGGRRGCSLM